MSENKVLEKEYIGARSMIAKFVAKIVPLKDVEDVVQDVYIRACQVKHEVYNPRSFLMKVAHNLALDHKKSAATRLCDSIGEIEDEKGEYSMPELKAPENTEQIVVDQERFEIFCRAVRDLPDRCQRAFILKKVYGHSQKEIAIEMNISESAVEKYVANGLRRCRQYLKSVEQDLSRSDTNLNFKQEAVHE